MFRNTGGFSKDALQKVIPHGPMGLKSCVLGPTGN